MNEAFSSATIAIHSWHPAFRPFKEQSRGFFGVEQSVSGASVPLIFAFPNPMKAIMLSDAASVYDTVNSKDKLESYFSQCSESCEVHSSYPRQKGDTFYNLWLPMRSKLSHYPIRLVCILVCWFDWSIHSNVSFGSNFAIVHPLSTTVVAGLMYLPPALMFRPLTKILD